MILIVPPPLTLTVDAASCVGFIDNRNTFLTPTITINTVNCTTFFLNVTNDVYNIILNNTNTIWNAQWNNTNCLVVVYTNIGLENQIVISPISSTNYNDGILGTFTFPVTLTQLIPIVIPTYGCSL